LFLLQVASKTFFSEEAIDDWYSPALKAKSVCLKERRFLTFPNYLILQVGRFSYQGSIAKKLDAFIDVPEDIDLEHLRAQPRDPNEIALATDDSQAIVPDEEVVSAITSMGFPRVRAERAWFNNQGKGAEAATEWLFNHMEDADIDTPLAQPKKDSNSQASNINPEIVEMMLSMGLGFSKSWTIKALENTGGDPDRAMEWLFSHEEPLNTEPVLPIATETTNLPQDGPGKYTLFAFITHMGTSPLSGHYVAHIKHGEKWIIFNDSKVAESQDPPTNMAYIYFYRRV